MMIINSFGLKGSVVLSSKDGNLSCHSHQKSERNLSSFIIFVFLLLGSLFLAPNKIHAQTVPSGWSDDGLNDGGGIRRYYNASEKWYVLKVYLPDIRVKPVYRFSSGVGTSNPIFIKKSMASWLSDSQTSGADALINASFYKLEAGSGSSYDVDGSEAEVAHPFGYNGNTVSWGYASNESGQKRLRIHGGIAYIETPNFSANFETIVTGYDPNVVYRDPNRSIGRTMAGISTSRKDLLYFFVTGKGGGATQAEAVSVLQGFGCNSYVMFDGSGSSQMAMDGTLFVVSDDPPYVPNRRVPIILRMDNR